MAGERDSDERWRRIDALFEAALERPPGARAAFLEAECSDPEIRRRVEALLDAESTTRSFLTARREVVGRGLLGALREGSGPESAWRTDPADPRPDRNRVGERVGPYRIEEPLGRGGMATVYRARREEGGFEQRVALKVIRGEEGSEDLIRRFYAEREILSSLQHPNIARLLDGGTTGDGLPYLVMDLVEGVPVTEYCRREGVWVEARLRLFLEIAAAVAYAHRNLVVHRDLKPTNILVTPEGRPVLLDFGIAKLLDPADGGMADPTLTRARWRTPGYGAPEQIRGGTVNTTTDVYQLGVLLYELLTERQPFPSEQRSVFEVEKAICETEPQRPGSVGAAEGRRIQGDLDAIVLKALRKEPEERYSSADAMSADIRRHLALEPVNARRGSRGYRARTFVRRNRWKLAAAAAFAVPLAAWAATATVQGARLARERDRAQAESEKAAQVTAFLASLMQAGDPRQAQGETVTVREVLDRGVDRIGDELEGQSDVQAELYLTTGTVYESLGEFDQAEPLLERALALRQETYGEEPAEELAEVQVQLGRLRLEQGRFEEAEPLMRSALAQRRALHPEGSGAIADDIVEVGDVVRVLGRYGEAEGLYREALVMYEALDAPPAASIAITRNNLALVYHMSGRLAEAMPLYEEAVAMLLDTLGARHPYTLVLQHNLAGFNRSLGRYALSDSLFREVIAAEREVVSGSADLASGIASRGVTLRLRGYYAEAAEALEEALELQEPLGPAHPSVSLRMRDLAGVRADQGRYDEARVLLEEVSRRRVEADGPNGDIGARQQLGMVYREAGRFDESTRLLEEVLARRREQHDAPHSALAGVLTELGVTLWETGELETARERLEEAAAMLRALDDDLPLAETLTRLAALDREWAALDEAEERLDEVEVLVAAFPEGTVHGVELAFERARILLARRDAEGALEGVRALQPWFERQYSEIHPARAGRLAVEGEALARLGRLDEAERLLLSSDAVLRNASAAERAASKERLAGFYEATGRPDEAEAVRVRAVGR